MKIPSATPSRTATATPTEHGRTHAQSLHFNHQQNIVAGQTDRTRAGFRGAGARAPGLPPTGGLQPNPSAFWLMIDVSLVILIEYFEINEN